MTWLRKADYFDEKMKANTDKLLSEVDTSALSQINPHDLTVKEWELYHKIRPKLEEGQQLTPNEEITWDHIAEKLKAMFSWDGSNPTE